MKKIVIGGLLAGVVIFLWGAAAHMVLPLGDMGLKVMPNEDPVLTAMRGMIPEPGLSSSPG